MPKFLLMLNEKPDTFLDLAPEEMQKIVMQYSAWADKMVSLGHYESGQKLKDEGGRLLRREKGKLVVTDGPFSETKEVVGGFHIIEAESYAKAAELCADHPGLVHGTSIHVREIDPLEGH